MYDFRLFTMKKNYLSLIILCCLLFAFNSADAQKKIERIHTYYQADAFYLTIKKIKELKPRLQSRKDIQYILADCYWNIGEKDRSLQLYKSVSKIGRVPVSYRTNVSKVKQTSTPKPLLISSRAVRIPAIAAAPIAKRKIVDFPISKKEDVIAMINCIKWH